MFIPCLRSPAWRQTPSAICSVIGFRGFAIGADTTPRLTGVPTSWTVAMAILVACLLASIVIAAIKL